MSAMVVCGVGREGKVSPWGQMSAGRANVRCRISLAGLAGAGGARDDDAAVRRLTGLRRRRK